MSVSFELVYQQYKSRVFSYISQRVAQREDAEDLCEEVFVKLHALLSRYDENRAAISTLIYKLSHDRVIDYYRTHHTPAALDEEGALLPASEDVVMDVERAREIRDALQRLPDHSRDILILRFYYGFTLKEIALKMGISYNSAISRQKSALNTLKSLLGE